MQNRKRRISAMRLWNTSTGAFLNLIAFHLAQDAAELQRFLGVDAFPAAAALLQISVGVLPVPFRSVVVKGQHDIKIAAGYLLRYFLRRAVGVNEPEIMEDRRHFLIVPKMQPGKYGAVVVGDIDARHHTVWLRRGHRGMVSAAGTEQCRQQKQDRQLFHKIPPGM